jgi:hypothetical protein
MKTNANAAIKTTIFANDVEKTLRDKKSFLIESLRLLNDAKRTFISILTADNQQEMAQTWIDYWLRER